ncbi:hypothetical protein [Komagataeibacter sp. FNDCF1]|uniref:hypothetical protein n=1 Tax=Komagataeibacter sp. FNDCF1 TaxID=2878681 RepID=UPI001E43C740|nr:hypothetical protein [Komagataeibacter sp. FNDCF1]MCE2564516.1 hypothetical protein [Komagataeibacter sp. FNDCF1]
MGVNMKRGMLVAMLALAPCGVGTQVRAAEPGTQDARNTCNGAMAELPDDLRDWAAPAPVMAAVNGAGMKNVILMPGRAVMARLHPVEEVKYALPPTHPAAQGSSGGMVVFEAPMPGTYRIMLGARAWLDVVRAGEAIASVHHEHGPVCSGIGKMVDFELPAGRSVIELSAGTGPEIEIMVIAVP